MDSLAPVNLCLVAILTGWHVPVNKMSAEHKELKIAGYCHSIQLEQPLWSSENVVCEFNWWSDSKGKLCVVPESCTNGN